MVRAALIASGLVCATGSVFAQDTDAPAKEPALSGVSAGSDMGKLLTSGYEIRAAVPNGTRYIVFLQKDQSAFACEFVTLTRSRCGSIN